MAHFRKTPYQAGREALFNWLDDHSLIPRLPDNPFDEGSEAFCAWENGFFDASKSALVGKWDSASDPLVRFGPAACAADRVQPSMLKG